MRNFPSTNLRSRLFVSAALLATTAVGCQSSTPLETVHVPQRLNPVSFPGTTSNLPHSPVDPSNYRGELSLAYGKAKTPVTRESTSQNRHVASRYHDPKKSSAGRKMMALAGRKSPRKRPAPQPQRSVIPQSDPVEQLLDDPFQSTVALRRVEATEITGRLASLENKADRAQEQRSRQIASRLDRVENKLLKLSDLHSAYRHSPKSVITAPGTISQQELQDLAQQHSTHDQGYFGVTPATFHTMSQAPEFESDVQIQDWPHSR